MCFFKCARLTSWKAYLILMAVAVPVAFLGIPYAMTIQGEALEEAVAPLGVPIPLWLPFVIDSVINLVLCAVLGGVGLLLAGRIGLGLPFIEGSVKRKPVWHRFPGVAAVGIVTGVVFAVVAIGLAIWVFGPPLAATIESEGIAISEDIVPPAWQGFLVSFQAGVLEEILFRLFGLTLLAWLGSLISRDKEGRPTLVALWIANILFAVAFGLAHLPLTSAVGFPLTPLVVARAIVLNGLGGVMFGWLYWSRGLESAMVAHASADVVLHAVFPLITGAATPVLSIVIGVVAAVVIVAIVVVLLLWKPARREALVEGTQPDSDWVDKGRS